MVTQIVNTIIHLSGLLEDSTMVSQQPNDAKSKSEIRRTRIKMLFEDFQVSKLIHVL